MQHGTGPLEVPEGIFAAVSQEKNLIQSYAPGRSEGRVTMPGGAVHPELPVLFSHNGSIVAEHLDPLLPIPERCQGAFAGSGFAGKQIAFTLVLDAAGVEDDAACPHQVIDHQQFHGRGCKRAHEMVEFFFKVKIGAREIGGQNQQSFKT